MENAKMTKRATALVNVVKKIEAWCNENISGKDISVFSLLDHHGVYDWYSWVYSSRHKKLYCMKDSHGSYSVNYGSFETGMSNSSFESYLNYHHGSPSQDYEMTNEDGNLVFEEEILDLKRAWPSTKNMLLRTEKETEEFEGFEA